MQFGSPLDTNQAEEAAGRLKDGLERARGLVEETRSRLTRAAVNPALAVSVPPPPSGNASQ